jgi:WD40-like Beta Propeller Repeat
LWPVTAPPGTNKEDSHALPRLVIITAIAALTAALAAASPASATSRGKNGLITFYAVTPDEGAQLFTVRPKGHDLRQITHGPGAAVNPDWSSDGRKITYEHDWGHRDALRDRRSR